RPHQDDARLLGAAAGDQLLACAAEPLTVGDEAIFRPRRARQEQVGRLPRLAGARCVVGRCRGRVAGGGVGGGRGVVQGMELYASCFCNEGLCPALLTAMKPTTVAASFVLLLSLLGLPMLLLGGDNKSLRPDNKPPPGFVALFNGKDLTGWKGLPVKEKLDSPAARAKASPDVLAKAQAAADKRMREHWKVEDGVLVFDGAGESLATARDDYGDFELYVDWKIKPEGDSGIYIRGTPQVQI